MKQVYQKKENCCGCTACMTVCPVCAIKMEADREGFLYPVIDQELCIDCGKCINTCDFKKLECASDNPDPQICAVKHIDESIRLSSTSGGAFTAISDVILNDGGIIYGAAFDSDLNVVHERAETPEERDCFKGSKYVQSDLKQCFKIIQNDLKNGKFVLFSGTPCQCAGLSSAIPNKLQKKMYLCDIVCKGTPSPMIWRSHIMKVKKIKNKKIKKYNCRSKIKGWGYHIEEIDFFDGEKDYLSHSSQEHSILYDSNCILRPSCHECKYTKLKRDSDITLADFWGIENEFPDFDDNKGVSMVLINTPKGKELFEKSSGELYIYQSTVQAALKQRNLNHPTEKSPLREQFWQDYLQYGYEYILKKYAGFDVKGKLKYWVKKKIGRV